LEKGKTQLVNLEDQIGRQVKLRGTAWSRNGDWWFDYRGTTVFVENMEKLTGWTVYHHGTPILITGILEEKRMSPIGGNKPLKKSFFIKNPNWEKIDSLLSSEKK